MQSAANIKNYLATKMVIPRRSIIQYHCCQTNHMITKRCTFLLLAALFVGLHAHGQGFLKAKGKIIVNAKGEEVILRGMGLGGWMLQEGYMLRVRGIGQQQHVIRGKLEELIGKEQTDEFYNRWLANHTRKADVDSMAAWGFNSIRLPMHYNLYTLPVEQEPVAGQNTWLEKGFAMTDSLLQWCKANKMYLILDLHAAPGGQGNDNNISDRDPSKPSLWDSRANQEKTIALWRRLAERYANEPWIGAYDIINEPNWGFMKAEDRNGCGEQKNEPLKKLMVEITETIRAVDKNHIIIIEGNCWGNNYNGIFPPWDNNTVVSFHKYWNYNDKASIQKFLDVREQYNVPVWLGESGENSNVWFRDAINLMETNHIGWSWWPLKKLGGNNPLEVKTPPGFQKVLDYWANEGPKPEKIAGNYGSDNMNISAGILALTDNIKIENTIYHRDVIDAMFRQAHSDKTIPFRKHDITKAIAAADYDLGRNRYAYSDRDTGNYYISTGGERTAGNKGHAYRNDGVDIKADNNGTYVTDTEAGEWLQYTLTAPDKGKYTLRLTTAAATATGKVYATVNGTKTKETAIPQTGGAEQWKPVDVATVELKKGTNVIRVYIVAGGFNYKTLELIKAGAKR